MSCVLDVTRPVRFAALALALAALTALGCASRDQQAAAPSGSGTDAASAAAAAESGTAEAAAPDAAGASPAPAAPAAPSASEAPQAAPQPPAGVAPPQAPADPSVPAPADGYRRVELPGGEGRPFPYTIDIPADWQQYEPEGTASIFFGPAGAKPGEDPRMIFVRVSPASLADPEATAASIRSSDAANAGWSAPLIEVRDVNGVKGVLVQMDSGEGAEARSTLALKLPLPKTSVDFMASAPRAELARLRPEWERILFSVRPRAGQ